MEKVSALVKKIMPRKVHIFLQPAYHFALSFLSALFYGFPSRNLTVIGVTGTKGKTTVIELLHEILKESGAKIASLSSLRFHIDQTEEANLRKMTMPGRFFIQKFLHKARRAGCKYAILEVTSEGIKQFRHRFINFDVALVTGVHPEHIEAHGSFEKYLRAKLDLFWRLPKDGLAIINRDDPSWQRFSAATPAHKMFYGKESIEKNGKIWRVRDLEMTEGGINFDLEGAPFSSRLLGEFNFYNILAATAVGLSQHMPLEKIVAAIARVANVPGRMEFIQREPFAVVVDYAHTPESLRNVYTFLRGNSKLEILNSKQIPNSKFQIPKLICVFGSAGGERDKWKRPELGKIAAEFCDEVILTNEDPYDENPATILDEIEAGFSKSTKPRAQSTKRILDRREAIREALKSARAGDIVVITGKGAEQWIMGPKGEKTPWDDRKIVREELEKLRP